MDAETNRSNGNVFQRSQSLDLQIVVVPHNQEPPGIPQETPRRLSRLIPANLQIPDNIQSVIREIQPFVDTARNISMTNFMNRPTQSASAENLGASIESSHVSAATTEPNETRDDAEAPNSNPNGDNNEPVNVENREIIEALKSISLMVPFVVILLLKAMYDHRNGIIHGLILSLVFAKANSVVRNEAATRQRRNNYIKLCLTLIYVNLIIFLMYFLSEDLRQHSIFTLIYPIPLTFWDVLWYVGITDYVFRLSTISLKILVTLMPVSIVSFQCRGKSYLLLEATSQFIRAFLPIPLWFCYYIYGYENLEQVIGFSLYGAYFITKSICIHSQWKLLKKAICKFLRTSSVGSSPSKEQLQLSGEDCPICHDKYKLPILLECSHIFCESCVTIWFDREQTCPLCRAKIVDDPSWCDGSTTFFLQWF